MNRFPRRNRKYCCIVYEWYNIPTTEKTTRASTVNVIWTRGSGPVEIIAEIWPDRSKTWILMRFSRLHVQTACRSLFKLRIMKRYWYHNYSFTWQFLSCCPDKEYLLTHQRSLYWNFRCLFTLFLSLIWYENWPCRINNLNFFTSYSKKSLS